MSMCLLYMLLCRQCVSFFLARSWCWPMFASAWHVLLCGSFRDDFAVNSNRSSRNTTHHEEINNGAYLPHKGVEHNIQQLKEERKKTIFGNRTNQRRLNAFLSTSNRGRMLLHCRVFESLRQLEQVLVLNNNASSWNDES